MRNGFTTGSCAAASAKAAAFMLINQIKIDTIEIITPAGIPYNADLCQVIMDKDYVSCGVVKDSGDDPDSTDGILVCAKVQKLEYSGVKIVGGLGVGRITRPGLEMPVGEAAINSVPRKMITEAVTEVIDDGDYDGGVEVTIFVPDGEEISKKTFNPHMGIEGGISILGTSGLVRPMSNEAILKTIELDIKMKYEEGNEVAILVPGNYGENFLVNTYGVSADKIIHYSNFVGFAIEKAVEAGFKKILIAGHTGKMVKVSGGIMNTHSKEADSRSELMLANAIRAMDKGLCFLPKKALIRILDSLSTTAALEILDEYGCMYASCTVMLERILFYLKKKAGDDIEIECILYENSYGLLAKSNGVEELI